MNIRDAEEGRVYTILGVHTEDEALDNFLFTLGCYAGERIRVVTHLKNSSIVMIKNGRYSIDRPLSESISICDKEKVKKA